MEAFLDPQLLIEACLVPLFEVTDSGIKPHRVAGSDLGCAAERIGEILGRRKFRGFDSEITDPDQMIEPIRANYPELRLALKRYYLDQPIHQHGRTWVRSKMWGKSTEQTLEALIQAFPAAGVGYRRADSG